MATIVSDLKNHWFVFMKILNTALPGRYSFVLSQQWKEQNNVASLFKVKNKGYIPRLPSFLDIKKIQIIA